MKKKILHYINILLGVASMALAGCHTKQAMVAEPEELRPALKYGVPPEVVELYGIPSPEAEEPDTIAPPQQEPPIMCKYGIPAPPPEVRPLYGVPVPDDVESR